MVECPSLQSESLSAYSSDAFGAVPSSTTPIDAVWAKYTILRDAEYLRDLVAKEVLLPSYVTSAEELADIFTKALARPAFSYLANRLISAEV